MALETQDAVTLVAALIGAVAAILAAIIPLIKRRRKTPPREASWVKPSHVVPLKIGAKQVVGVRAGNYQDLEIRLAKGDRLEGFVVETRGRPVRVLLVDVSNLVAFHNDRAFAPAWRGEGEGGYAIDWQAPEAGSWFLVVDAQRDADEREVELLLHRAARPEAP